MNHFIILLACLQYSMTLYQKEWPTQHQSLNPRCPDGWLDGLHLGCYLFLYQDTSLSWMEAQGICEQHGGFLAEVKDEEQQNFIESFAIIEESMTGVTSWWLGLTDSGHEGRWIWSHSDTEVSFTSWSPGHPNSSPANQDDCVSISLEDHFHWKDVPCFSQSHTSPSPICHRFIHPQTTTQPASTDSTTIPTTSHPLPTTSHPLLTTSHPLPTTSHHLPTTSHSLPTTSHSLPTTSHHLPTTSHPIPTTSHPLPTTSHHLPTTSHSIPTTSTTTPTTRSSGFLLLGGTYDRVITNSVEVYGSDLILPSMPSLPLPLETPIAEMTESGAVYVAGGFNTSGSYITNDKTFMLSSLSSSMWEELEARMPIPVCWSGSVVVKDIVLVLGGINSDGSVRDDIQLLDTSKSLPTWKLLNHSKLPEPLSGHSVAIFEGQVIIVNERGGPFSDLVTFTTSVSSIISDTQLDWVRGELPGVGGELSGPSVEVIEGKLVAVYGSQVFTKITMDSQWVQLKPLPREKYRHPSIGSVQGNIVIGGGGGFGATDTVFMWLKASSEWEEVTSLKIPRCHHATVQLPRGIL